MLENYNGYYIVANPDTYNFLTRRGYKLEGRWYTVVPRNFDYFIIGNGSRTTNKKENTFYANATVEGGYEKLDEIGTELLILRKY